MTREQQNRQAKAERFAKWLVAHGEFAAAEVRRSTPEEWAALADAIGEKIPSAATIEEIARQLEADDQPRCPGCGRPGTMRERSANSVEPHGERFEDRWLECSECGVRAELEVQRG